MTPTSRGRVSRAHRSLALLSRRGRWQCQARKPAPLFPGTPAFARVERTAQHDLALSMILSMCLILTKVCKTSNLSLKLLLIADPYFLTKW